MAKKTHIMLLISCPKCQKKDKFHFIGALPLTVIKKIIKGFHCDVNGKWRIQKFIEIVPDDKQKAKIA